MRDEKIDRIEAAVQDLVTVMKGYNGFKGVARTVQDNTEGLQTVRTTIEPLVKLIPIIEEHSTKINVLKASVDPLLAAFPKLETTVKKLEAKPGNTALKWLNRAGVALLGAAAVAGFTLWIESLSITRIEVVNQHTPQLMPVNPNQTQFNVPTVKKE